MVNNCGKDASMLVPFYDLFGFDSSDSAWDVMLPVYDNLLDS